MAQNSRIVVLIIAVTIGAVLFVPFANVVADSTDTQSVEDEEFEADVDEWVNLEWFNIVEDSETVEYFDEGASEWETLDDADYQMNYSAGSINVDSESENVDDGDTLRISYDYEPTDGTTAQVLGLTPLLLALLLLVTLGMKVQEMM